MIFFFFFTFLKLLILKEFQTFRKVAKVVQINVLFSPWQQRGSCWCDLLSSSNISVAFPTNNDILQNNQHRTVKIRKLILPYYCYGIHWCLFKCFQLSQQCPFCKLFLSSIMCCFSYNVSLVFNLKNFLSFSLTCMSLIFWRLQARYFE